MNPSVRSAEVSIYGGVLAGSIPFEQGLNILSGENGTCKTQVLREIKSAKITPTSEAVPKILAFSPKRNAERKSIDAILQLLRSQKGGLAEYMAQRAGVALQDTTFENYAPFGELFYRVYEDECRDGGKRIERMDQVTTQFNDIIGKVFENYELVAEWDTIKGSPNVRVRKHDQEIGLESLSLGEQEVLSLVLNVYAARTSHDVFLIDEPEIHLNWHLEEKLFGFLDWFCSEHGKQVIVATHSRVVFKDYFLRKTQFFFWENGRIRFGRSLPDEQRTRIAGDAIEVIKLGNFPTRTFFVENHIHEEVVRAIADMLKTDMLVVPCGKRNNVTSLFRLSMKEQGWHNAFFLVDGDNEGNPFPDEPRFICLDKYCMENYLLDFETTATLTNKSEQEIREAVLKAIKANKRNISKNNRFFESLVDRLELEDITEASLDKLDASQILATCLQEIGIKQSAYVREYVKSLFDRSRLESVFPTQLTASMKAG